MKREAISHTKMKRLCRRLDIAQWQGVGLLESMWHLTARETPRGNIGKLSDEDIALAIDYRGDETAMIAALVESGWIDRDGTERLVIHDWPDHADDAVHMRLARNREVFVGGRAPKISKLTGRERESAVAFYQMGAQTPDSCARPRAQESETCAQKGNLGALPEPRQSPAPPEPIPEPTSLEVLTPLEAKILATARKMFDRHPSIRRCSVCVIEKQLRAIAKRFPAADRIAKLVEIDAVHSAWCETHDWQKEGGQYSKGLENWLAPTKDRYLMWPPEASAIRAPSKLERSIAEAGALFDARKAGRA